MIVVVVVVVVVVECDESKGVSMSVRKKTYVPNNFSKISEYRI